MNLTEQEKNRIRGLHKQYSVITEQVVTQWDCENGECVKVGYVTPYGVYGSVGEFASEQECEDSNCEERARPGGYGVGKVDKIEDRTRGEF